MCILGSFQRMQPQLVCRSPLTQSPVMRKQKTKKQTKLSQSITWSTHCMYLFLLVFLNQSNHQHARSLYQWFLALGARWDNNLRSWCFIAPSPYRRDYDQILWWFYWAARVAYRSDRFAGFRKLHFGVTFPASTWWGDIRSSYMKFTALFSAGVFWEVLLKITPFPS